MHKLINVSNDAVIADQLGELRAKINDLKQEQAFLENLLKAKRVKVAEGELFRVRILYDVVTVRTDWKAVAMILGANNYPEMVKAHTKHSESDRVSVTAYCKA